MIKKSTKHKIKKHLKKHHAHIFTFVAVVVVVMFVYNMIKIGDSKAQVTKAPTNGLIAYWNLDEGSGEMAYDATANGNVGTLKNSPSWSDGKVGKAITFDGINDKVLVGDTASLDVSTNAITLSAWINNAGRNNYNQYSYIVGKSASSATPYALYFNNGNRAIVMGINGTSTCAKVGSVQDGSWHLLTGVYDGSKVYIYVDGVLKGTCNKTGNIIPNNDPFIIGDKGTGNNNLNPFKGNIDEVRVYNRALSMSEVNDIYNDTIPKDNIPPSVSIVSPVEGDALEGFVTLSATASDNVAIAGVQFVLNGANFGAEDITLPYSVLFDTTYLENGSHTLHAVARDTSDNQTSSAPVNVTVDNSVEPPLFNTYQVGPDRQYKKPSEVASLVVDGDVVEIDAGVYENDFVVWKTNNLTLRGVGDGYAHMKMTLPATDPATGGSSIPNGKSIWVVNAKNILIENIEFSGAKVPDRNGAGIRGQNDMILRNCYFHDNENGILTSAGTVTIENSEFYKNGNGDGKTHNIYISSSPKLVVKNSYFHGSVIGHNIKSRAMENHIFYNRITDDTYIENSDTTLLGNGSYAIDLSNGGLSYVIGNEIQQGNSSPNSVVIAYGLEGLKTANGQINEFYFVNNTVVNEKFTLTGKPNVTFVKTNINTPVAKSINNIYVGLKNGNLSGALFAGATTMISQNDVTDPVPGIQNKKYFDYSLMDGSPAINAGVNPGSANNVDMLPLEEYKHPLSGTLRNIIHVLDAGAHEK